MDQELLSPDAWSGLLGSLPAGLGPEVSARERRAGRRARGGRSAADLLRLALAYANPPLSLRGTAAWATAAGVADLSDVALLYRLQNAEGWLEGILAALLAARVETPAGLRRPVGIVDATNLTPTGGRHGTAWRVHARFDPAAGRFAEFRLTEGTAPESLARFSPPAGAVCVADRIDAKARGLFAAKDRGADVVVRYGVTGCALLGEDGGRLGLKDVLARGDLPDLADLPVRVPRPDAADGPPLDARLILWRGPADVAAAARERPRREARRKGYEAGAKQLGGAGWLGPADHARQRRAGRGRARLVPLAVAGRAGVQAPEEPAPPRRPPGQGPASRAELRPGQADPGSAHRPVPRGGAGTFPLGPRTARRRSGGSSGWRSPACSAPCWASSEPQLGCRA